jgi:hypothetical protein
MQSMRGHFIKQIGDLLRHDPRGEGLRREKDPARVMVCGP